MPSDPPGGIRISVVRGSIPLSLYIETYVMLTDLVGKPLGGVISFPTPREPRQLVSELGRRIKSLISEHREISACAGVGVVVPGMVEHSTMRVLHAPTLGWRNVDLREPLAAATGLSVQIENSGRACALAQVWAHREGAGPVGDLVFISVSDGIGVGVIIHGEVLRGRHNIAGEFGHVPLSLDGPRCSCGANGCWEAYVSNRATLGRYFGRPADAGGPIDAAQKHFTIEDLIARARGNDAKAATALQTTARYLGLGLASVINALDPARVYVGGEITLAWDLIAPTVRLAVAERALTSAAGATDIQPVAASEYPRLQGAVALVAAPAFAAPVVA
jgi:N-acetylglucosamine repressor